MPTDRPVSRPALPAAVSTLVAEVVRGERVAATVVAAHRYALYLSVRGSVLPVVTSDAVALPTAVRVAAPAGAVSWGVDGGDEVLVGGGRIALTGLDVVAVRTWRPSRVRPAASLPRGECGSGCQDDHFRTPTEVDAALAPGTAGDGRDEREGMDGRDERDGRGWLADGIRQALSPRGECGNGCQGDHLRTRGEVGATVAGLVGRGPGLTPSGDDALAGALLVAHALDASETLADAVRARLVATTVVSAALLDAAADGYAARPVVTLVDAAVATDPEGVRRALPAVLAIGHTSGADTVTGIRAALDSLTPRHECGSGCQGDHFRTHGGKKTRRSAA